MSAAVGVEELRSLFLFEALTDEQLDWLAERSERRTYAAGAVVCREGEPATHLFMLLDGALRLLKLSGGEDVVINETDQRGAYAGAVRAYVEPEGEYGNSVIATAPSSFLALPGIDFATFMRTWFPMAVHLLDGLYLGVRNSEATIREREHLARLGTLSANLAHELNNPAAAAVRATGQLRERVAGVRGKLSAIASGKVSSELLARLVDVQDESVNRAAAARRQHRSAVDESDLEDALLERLDELGVAGAYDLAPVFAGAGLDVSWLDAVVTATGDDPLPKALRWLADTLETESLMDEVEEATTRISTLVAAVKQYSYMDSASVQDVDVHVGLDSTTVMLGHKLTGVEVVRDYEPSLPKVPAYAAELNQVWTNLIDNAADAMEGTGRGGLWLRTRRDDEHLVVEVRDDGDGIPAEAQPRVFEPFFTTKAPGEGSGLGLDNARRIVERRHRGRLAYTTGPEGTAFEVRLPLVQELR
jgi:signal transduction histidine kinase